jgi:hypothetical protein
MEYIARHLKRLFGPRLLLEITPLVVKKYQVDRLNEKAAAKSINDEVGMLLRQCGS